jgi:aspartyl/asparaginyl beta-hydroxylase (cupin superfamily)
LHNYGHSFLTPEAIMSRDPSLMTDPQQCLGEAIVTLRDNQPNTARDLAQRAVELGLDDTTVWGVIALANRDLADYENAHLAADRAIARDPRNARAYIVKADAFYAQSNMKAAAAFYRQALMINPLHPDMVQEIRVEFLRAQTRVQELQQAFADHMTREVQPLLDEPESTSRMQEAVDLLLGKRKQYYPQPRHIMYPGLPIHEFYPRDPFPWLEALEAKTEAIQAELQNLISGGGEFNAYLESNTERPAFDSHGMADNDDWGALYLWRNGEPVPENQALCPVTTEAMNALPLVFSGQRCPNILFSRLRPGATIPPHNGMINTRLIGHLPLIIPEGCGFRVGNSTRTWNVGEAFLFDDTIEHEAWNNSNEDRFVLIFEVWRPELTEAEQRLSTRMLTAVDSY